MTADLLLITTTVADRETAERLAARLVDQRLAACVQIVPGLRSVYRWEGRVVTDDEVQLMIKARATTFDAIESALRADHPYDVPEIVAIPAARVSRDYLDWLVDATSTADASDISR